MVHGIQHMYICSIFLQDCMTQFNRYLIKKRPHRTDGFSQKVAEKDGKWDPVTFREI